MSHQQFSYSPHLRFTSTSSSLFFAQVEEAVEEEVLRPTWLRNTDCFNYTVRGLCDYLKTDIIKEVLDDAEDLHMNRGKEKEGSRKNRRSEGPPMKSRRLDKDEMGFSLETVELDIEVFSPTCGKEFFVRQAVSSISSPRADGCFLLGEQRRFQHVRKIELDEQQRRIMLGSYTGRVIITDRQDRNTELWEWLASAGVISTFFDLVCVFVEPDVWNELQALRCQAGV